MFEFLIVLCLFCLHLGKGKATSGNTGSKTPSKTSKSTTGGKRNRSSQSGPQASSSVGAARPAKIPKSGRKTKGGKEEKELDRNPKDENFFAGKLCFFLLHIYIVLTLS